jgi:endonuclease G
MAGHRSAKRKKDEAPALERALFKALIRNKAKRWLTIDNVTSTGIGFKTVKDVVSGEVCVQFTVARKLPPAELKRKNLLALPQEIELEDGTKLRTDVVERQYRLAYELVAPEAMVATVAGPSPAVLRRRRLDTIVPGASIGRLRGQGAGTIGAIVFDRLTRAPMCLSNWHVLAGPNSSRGDLIVQPATWDDSRVNANVVGALVRSYVGLAGDGAIASITNRAWEQAVFELGIVPTELAIADLNDRVIKSGRTTGVTFGVVSRTNVVVKHQHPRGGMLTIGGFEIAPDPIQPEITDEGDSGSVWLARNGSKPSSVALGLHFAIDATPNALRPVAVACNLHSILNKLDVTLTR